MMTMSIVRNNLLSRRGYTPYCGNIDDCQEMPRTYFTGKQFRCRACGWESSYEPEFIKLYEERNAQHALADWPGWEH